jgi:hypothetical protein
MEGLTEGRIVHFVLPNGQHRPAIVVNAWHHVFEYHASGRVNLQVFTDFKNDGEEYASGQYWATSVPYSEDPQPGTWHWIEKA